MKATAYETAIVFKDGRKLYVFIASGKGPDVVPEDVRQAWKFLKKVRDVNLGAEAELPGLSEQERLEMLRHLSEKGYDARPAALCRDLRRRRGRRR